MFEDLSTVPRGTPPNNRRAEDTHHSFIQASINHSHNETCASSYLPLIKDLYRVNLAFTHAEQAQKSNEIHTTELEACLHCLFKRSHQDFLRRCALYHGSELIATFFEHYHDSAIAWTSGFGTLMAIMTDSVPKSAYEMINCLQVADAIRFLIEAGRTLTATMKNVWSRKRFMNDFFAWRMIVKIHEQDLFDELVNLRWGIDLRFRDSGGDSGKMLLAYTTYSDISDSGRLKQCALMRQNDESAPNSCQPGLFIEAEIDAAYGMQYVELQSTFRSGNSISSALSGLPKELCLMEQMIMKSVGTSLAAVIAWLICKQEATSIREITYSCLAYESSKFLGREGIPLVCALLLLYQEKLPLLRNSDVIPLASNMSHGRSREENMNTKPESTSSDFATRTTSQTSAQSALPSPTTSLMMTPVHLYSEFGVAITNQKLRTVEEPTMLIPVLVAEDLPSPSTTEVVSNSFPTRDVSVAPISTKVSRQSMIPCPRCGKAFSTISNRNKHLQGDCRNGPKAHFPCRNAVCKKILTRASYRNDHERKWCRFRDRRRLLAQNTAPGSLLNVSPS